MSPQIFIFIESNTSGTGVLFSQAANELGFISVVLAATPEDYAGSFPAETMVHQVNTDNAESIMEWVKQHAPRGVAGVYSSSDYFVGRAAEVAAKLGLSSASSRAIAACRQKLAQRKILADHGLLMPTSVLVTDPQQIVAAFEKAGPRVVIKPQSGSGSYGVRFSGNLKDAFTWGAHLLAMGSNERGQPFGGVLVEEFLGGKEYSVEVFDGQPLIVTEKHLSEMPYFVEVGHDMPAAVSKDSEMALMECARAATIALNLTWGPVHVELRMTERGPVVIEVNPRLAGGYIPNLVYLCIGINLIKATIIKATGGVVSLRKNSSRHAGIRFFKINGHCRLLGVDNWLELAKHPLVVDAQLYTKVGDERQIHNDFRDRIGHVIASGEKREDIDQALVRVMAIPEFKWETIHA